MQQNNALSIHQTCWCLSEFWKDYFSLVSISKFINCLITLRETLMDQPNFHCNISKMIEQLLKCMSSAAMKQNPLFITTHERDHFIFFLNTISTDHLTSSCFFSQSNLHRNDWLCFFFMLTTLKWFDMVLLDVVKFAASFTILFCSCSKIFIIFEEIHVKSNHKIL